MTDTSKLFRIEFSFKEQAWAVIAADSLEEANKKAQDYFSTEMEDFKIINSSELPEDESAEFLAHLQGDQAKGQLN